MRLFGLDWSRKDASLSVDQLIRRLEAVYDTVSGIVVTPETALQAPTVQAVVRAIGGYLSTLPVRVLLKSTSKGRDRKEPLPNHPVQRLLNDPNETQDRVSYWLDASSWLLRYGNFFAVKGRGATGPIRRLIPISPDCVTVEQTDDLTLRYRVNLQGGEQKVYLQSQIHHARRMARNGWLGDSPVMLARESIALEIAAERFGAGFFANGAMPGIILKYVAGSKGHRSEEDRKRFLDEFQSAFTARGRFRSLLLPMGIEMAEDPITLDNDKAQFLDTRKYQRTVIAGVFGVPPQFVGDLDRATFNNAEQQSLDFVQHVILPDVRVFEAAMERDLLTDDDRAAGVIIRFNLDAALRGDYLSRQQGLKLQRENGIVNPNEWREQEGLNPRTDPGGEAYWDQGPSGQGTGKPAAEPAGNNGNGGGA